MIWLKKQGPGLLLSVGLALAASLLGYAVPLIGGPVFGILIGIGVNHWFGKPDKAMPGIVFSSKKLLQWAIVLLGCGLSLQQVFRTGLDSLYVLLFTLLAAFLAAWLFGRWLGVARPLVSLIGVGTAICGGSAIAAVSPIIEAEELEIAYSISTVFLFNVVAVLLFPLLGHAMGLSDKGFGLWAGTAINDTSSVVAAGYAYSDQAGAYATIVKLTRTTFIIPVSLGFAIATGLRKKREARNTGSTYSFKRIFPWFILWFLAGSLLNSLGLFSGHLADVLQFTAKFMITVALTAIGLNADFRKMRKTGLKPLLLGAIVWAAVIISSLLVQFLSGRV